MRPSRSRYVRQHTVSPMVALMALSLGGCCGAAKPEYRATATQMETQGSGGKGDSIEVVRIKVEATSDKSRIEAVKLDGKTPVSSGECVYHAVCVRADELPVGPSKVTLNLTVATKYPVLKKWKTQDVKYEVDVDRKAIAPKLRSAAGGGTCASSKDRVCLNLVTLDKSATTKVSLDGTPNSKVDFGGQPSTLGANGKAEATLDLSTQLLNEPASGSINLPVTVTSPDGLSEKGTLLVAYYGAVADVLRNANAGPALFPKEPPTVGVPKVVVLFDKKKSNRTIGAGKVSEIELVAFEKELPARDRSCGQYRNTKTGVIKTVVNSARDSEVALYQRKTGKLLTTKRFIAPMPACEKTINAKYSGTYDEVSSKTIDDWLKTQVK